MPKLMSCHTTAPRQKKKLPEGTKHLTIALAGNANVGKSVIFNQLTGSSQIIGNWPGKTVEKAEGSLFFEGYQITIVDLPGIYSLSAYSPDEVVSREYIADQKPDVVINILDVSVLERNLFLTLQLKEMEVPLVICLNQMDVAAKNGTTVDIRKLERELGVPVVPTSAVKGEGLRELVRKAIEVAEQKCELPPVRIGYDSDIEERIEKLRRQVMEEAPSLPYAPRWVAIKLLEDDPEVAKLASRQSPRLLPEVRSLEQEIERQHGQPCFAVIAAERHALAQQISSEALRAGQVRVTFGERLDWLTTHRVFGYATAAAVIIGLLLWTFTVGNFLSILLSSALSFFQPVDPKVSGAVLSVLWNGVFGGFVAGVTLVIPYVFPFYLMLALIEDSGVLTRVAFMMDSAMHKLGLHGKAIIPLILGYGCNVPAIAACRIMETRRERLLAAFAITLLPCTARTIVILGLVAVFVGTQWALALYVVDLVLVFLLARVALKVVPGQLTGLIMEMHSFKTPSFSIVARQTWVRTKSLIYMVFPIYMVGTAIVQVLYAVGALEPVNNLLSFMTVGWLGLPAITGILLIFGAVRKELILLTLVAIYGPNLALYLTPAQFIVLAFIGILYLPCIATIAILAKEFGWKSAAAVSLANVAAALVLGGIAYRLVTLVG